MVVAPDVLIMGESKLILVSGIGDLYRHNGLVWRLRRNFRLLHVVCCQSVESGPLDDTEALPPFKR